MHGWPGLPITRLQVNLRSLEAASPSATVEETAMPLGACGPPLILVQIVLALF